LNHHPGASRHPSWPGGAIRVSVKYVIALKQEARFRILYLLHLVSKPSVYSSRTTGRQKE
jgi:hypothetical protein